ncbi:MAG: hypothetical protein R3C49_22175 [Planctomycetaceae bacterium]
MKCWTGMIAVGLSSCFAAVPAVAQVAFGVTLQNGVVTGGGFQVGGFVSRGGTHASLSVNVGTSQLVGISNFMLPPVVVGGNGSGNQNPVAASPPTPQQFVQAAGRFDRNGNQQLERNELTAMAAAVLKELQQRNVIIAGNRPDGTAMTRSHMVEAFVSRCLHYDADHTESLDSVETTRMASDLLRSLSS